MTTMNKGWLRVLAVLSVIWLLLILGFVFAEYLSRNPFDQFPGGREPPIYFFWHWSGVDLFAPKGEQIRQLEPNLVKIVSVLVGPVGLLWLLGWSAAWIYDGFKRRS